MGKLEILTIAENVLGKYRQTGPDNYAFFCPHCKHYKRKLEINLETFNYHCWTCTPKRGGRNFFFLFRELSNVSDIQLEKIKEYTNTHLSQKSDVQKTILRLPKEFKSMQQEWKSVEYKHAKVYLSKRGLTPQDIKKYNIGFCEDGEYGERIIVPSYDMFGELNYFVGRSFFDSNLKYKNPKVSKDIVAFENLISYDQPIVLCEGVFDAMAIKRNAIPLLGKFVQPQLKNRLEIKKVKDIYVCLDNDARTDAVKIAEELLSINPDTNVYLVRLEQKDPSEIGFRGMVNLLKETPKFNFKSLIYTRLFE